MFRRLNISFQTLCFAETLVKNYENHKDLQVEVQLAFGKYYLRLQNKKSTYFHYNQAINLINEHSNIDLVITIYLRTSEACQLFKDQENSLINALIAVQFSEQIFQYMDNKLVEACGLAFFNLAQLKVSKFSSLIYKKNFKLFLVLQ